jgi:Protein of unknown function (DUF1822)
MMTHSAEDLMLAVPLTFRGHHAAQLFYQQHSDPQKAKQVYLNTLAIDAVHSYLSWLGITTDLSAGESWTPAIQALADVADLVIPGQGKLECRPVLPGASVCDFPLEVWADRLGYIAVQLDADLKTATLVGFAASVDRETVPLDQLQSIAALLEHLKPQIEPLQPMVYLGQWLQGQFTSGWQAVAELFEPQPMLSFRSITLPTDAATFNVTTRGKLLKLTPDDHLSNAQVILIIEVALSDLSQVDIWVKLCPDKHSTRLPEDLEVRVLDEQGTVVMQAYSRQTEMLQLKFQGTVGEHFSVETVLNNISLVETFVI